MANLQIKGINDDFYAQIKTDAAGRGVCRKCPEIFNDCERYLRVNKM